jgi:ELWxxDGT repeat protein
VLLNNRIRKEMRFLLVAIPVIILLSGITTCYMQPVGYDANPSVYSPAGLSFVDRDHTADEIEGDLYIQPAEDESIVTDYNVYLGTSTTKNAIPEASYPSTGSTIIHNFGANTPLGGRTHIHVCGVGPDGEYGECRKMDIQDIVVEVFPGGICDNIPTGFWEMNGYLYMSLEKGADFFELFRTDGVNSINIVGSLQSIYGPVVELDGNLYYVANGGAGTELSWYDGSTEGQFDVTAGAGSSNVSLLEILNGHLFFCDNNTGVLYYIDDSMNNQSVTPVAPAVDPDTSEMIPLNNYLYMDCDTTDGVELCRADETGVTRLADINTGAGNSNPHNFIVYNNRVYFAADDGTNGVELWVTDGTAGGTVMVKNINSGGSSDPDNMTLFDNRLFFRANDGITGWELWATDGTTAGTVLVKDTNPGAADGSPLSMVAVGNNLYLSTNNGIDGRELWISDGTSAGTYMLKDINPGLGGSGPGTFHSFKGKVFFRADDGANGKELWVTDGSAANTYMVGDIDPGASGMYPLSPTVFNDKVYYSTDIGSGEVWVLYYQ